MGQKSVWAFRGVTLGELVDAVAEQEVVDCKTNPRAAQQNNRDNNFPEDVDFLGGKQVINAPDGASQTNQIKNSSHNCVCLVFNIKVTCF